MKLYRFSPVEDKEHVLEAIGYVIKQATKLFFNVVGEANCTIEYATLFAHYNDEYDKIVSVLKMMGELEEANNGVRVKLSEPLEFSGGSVEVNGEMVNISHQIKYVRVRKPDPYRMQVGCVDFEEEDYDYFKDLYGMYTRNPRTIEREQYEMLEFHDPNIDVLAYMVSPSLNS